MFTRRLASSAHVAYLFLIALRATHLLQPLEISCISPLKCAYSCKLDGIIRHLVNHFTKFDFLQAFKAAFGRTLIPSNICSAFRGIGLVTLQPDAVLSSFDINMRTLTPPAILAEALRQTRTLSNTCELEAKSTLTRNRV